MLQREPDAHGQAAILLVESLMHGLIARSVITVEDASEIVDIAAEVESEAGGERGGSPTGAQTSLDLLQSISTSLRRDLLRD